MLNLFLFTVILAPWQVNELIQNAGFPMEVWGTMRCIAKYESGFDSGEVHINKNGSKDIGLFQINKGFWGKICTGNLFDPVVNTACAKTVYVTQGLTAWVAYKKHKQICDGTL